MSQYAVVLNNLSKRLLLNEKIRISMGDSEIRWWGESVSAFARSFIGLIFQACLQSLQKEFLLTPVYTITLLFVCKTYMRNVQIESYIEFMLDFSSYGIACKSC